ncbi:MAG: PAS domain-containing protein, partial [Elusimicrobiota bacterium]
AAVSLEEIERKVKELRRGTVWITLCAALLALAAALLLSRSLAAPVLAMCAAADKMAAGDLGARVRSCSQDEHGRLGRTLDLLAEKAQSTIAALSHEKAQLTMILSTMVEAVVAVDSRKSILTVNEAFARLAGLPAEQAAGKAFGEALRN